MKPSPRLTSLNLISLVLVTSTLNAVTPPEGFTALFNGKDLSGWHGNNPHVTAKANDKAASLAEQAIEFAQSWKVEDGVLIGDGEGPYATSDKEYGDIELMLEYKFAKKADSGIYLRGTPQVQIWDTTEEGGFWKHGARKGSGGLWNNSHHNSGQSPLTHADAPVGEWNKMRIRQIGSRTWVLLNGQLVVDGAKLENYWDKDTPIPARGHIHLQTHGKEVHWRNIFVREIEATEANRILSSLDEDGFEPIFDGASHEGWLGATNNYAIEEGTLVSQRGGTMYTEKEYSDFTFKFEFKLPKGGNNGLAIRYPGNGDPAYTGMCELQILDDTAAQYADLDPRQYHGSIYGYVAPKRGYLRPTGEWNFQTVHVIGSRIRVELNGTIIADSDLSELSGEFMSTRFKNPLPTKGHLGLAGHGYGVVFRNLQLREDI